MRFAQKLDEYLDDKLVNALNADKDFYSILNACSELSGKIILVEGVPVRRGKINKIPYNITMRDLLSVTLGFYGYIAHYGNYIICLKSYAVEPLSLQYGELSGALVHMAKMLKTRGYSSKSPGGINEDYKNLFDSLNLQHKNILMSGLKQSPRNSEEIRKYLEGLKKSPLSKDSTPLDTSVNISLNMMTANQFDFMSRCINNSEINSLLFNVQRGIDTALRVASNDSIFSYSEKRFFTSLVNQRVFEGKPYTTVISPVSRVQLNFTSAVYSEDPLTEPDFSDPSPNDYNRDGSMKNLFLEDETYNITLSELIRKSFNVVKVTSACGLEDKSVCVFGKGKINEEMVIYFLKKAYNYMLVPNGTNEIAIEYPKYNRALLRSGLKEFIDYYSLASTRRFYDNALKSNASLNVANKISDNVLADAINNLKRLKIKQFRICFDAFLKQSGKKMVYWNELPISCKDDIITVFCIEAFTAIEKMRRVNPLPIPRKGTVRFMLRKSYANYFLTFQILSPEGNILATNSGIIAKDAPEQ